MTKQDKSSCGLYTHIYTYAHILYTNAHTFIHTQSKTQHEVDGFNLLGMHNLMTILFNHDHYNHLQNFSDIPNRDCPIEQEIPIPLIPAPVNYQPSYFMKLAHLSVSYTVILSQDFSFNYGMFRHHALRTQRCTAHSSILKKLTP